MALKVVNIFGVPGIDFGYELLDGTGACAGKGHV